ncbi:hypothetical protein HBI56_120720 [Parastagonospora nodorum]|uniref:Uncharacterized protein n=1 Tax=Phaeosphaeria nodorum (strain SN15 / ATCC MYA-4574 / FGSC 10173) TaxID=321614 RepID=A0A7U2FBP8_PHANO|nr:hypothetical protein HBH56_054000 [Parastagonospora nodorum]QRD02292.1 hypothetical protein JI435_052680 [Parastagonospora nodorum SN15]KAH3935871.1 hypothetical protein HBH54_039800 [Parastagonospora nodorum]KAH3969981.1 hypothetical protein HBH51_119940 [Parastagonospora nodorum]KAH3988820.1 hypothetical protein HBH52_028460 [Parastagonospora nodorum]
MSTFEKTWRPEFTRRSSATDTSFWTSAAYQEFEKDISFDDLFYNFDAAYCPQTSVPKDEDSYKASSPLCPYTDHLEYEHNENDTQPDYRSLANTINLTYEPLSQPGEHNATSFLGEERLFATLVRAPCHATSTEIPKASLAPSASTLSQNSQAEPDFLVCDACSTCFTGAYRSANLARHIRQMNHGYPRSERPFAPLRADIKHHSRASLCGKHDLEPDGIPLPGQHTASCLCRGTVYPMLIHESASDLGMKDIQSVYALKDSEKKTSRFDTEVQMLRMLEWSKTPIRSMGRQREWRVEEKQNSSCNFVHHGYKAIHNCKPIWSWMFLTLILSASQVVYCLALRNFEICQGASTGSCGPSLESDFILDKLWAHMNSWSYEIRGALPASLLGHMKSPSPFAFACIAFLYCTTVFIQQRINIADRYQYVSVVTGAMIGLGLLASSVAISDGRPRTTSTLAFSVSVSMLLGACADSIRSTILCHRKMHLRSETDEWMQSSMLEPEKGRAE